jgi:hypothetical protein
VETPFKNKTGAADSTKKRTVLDRSIKELKVLEFDDAMAPKILKKRD